MMIEDEPSHIQFTNIFLIRHGESFNNCLYEYIWSKLGKNISEEELISEEIKLREADCKLSDRGILQAQKLGQYLFMNPIAPWNNVDIFTSPMRRCLLTTHHVTNQIPYSNNATVIPYLYESNGCYEHIDKDTTVGIKGSTAREIEYEFPNFKCLDMEEGWYHLPEMETSSQFIERAKRVSDWIWKLHDENISQNEFRSKVIFCHGNLINVILNNLTNSKCLFVHNNTGVSHIQLCTLKSGKKIVSLSSLNRVDHLMIENNHSLLSGANVIDDHWIQEYLEYHPSM